MNWMPAVWHVGFHSKMPGVFRALRESPRLWPWCYSYTYSHTALWGALDFTQPLSHLIQLSIHSVWWTIWSTACFQHSTWSQSGQLRVLLSIPAWILTFGLEWLEGVLEKNTKPSIMTPHTWPRKTGRCARKKNNTKQQIVFYSSVSGQEKWLCKMPLSFCLGYWWKATKMRWDIKLLGISGINLLSCLHLLWWYLYRKTIQSSET